MNMVCTIHGSCVKQSNDDGEDRLKISTLPPIPTGEFSSRLDFQFQPQQREPETKESSTPQVQSESSAPQVQSDDLSHNLSV